MESSPNIKTDTRDPSEECLSSEKATLSDSQPNLASNLEVSEHLQVYLRVRPFTSAESDNGESQDCVSIEAPDIVLLKPPSLSLSARQSSDRSLLQTGQRFQFSQVYGPETTQKELFEGTVKDLVKDVLRGGNSLVFTYGVTNAGKTHTFLGPDADAGILPRSLDVIFGSIDERVFSGMAVKPHRSREFIRLTREQQAEEAAFRSNLFRQLKESEKSNTSLLNSTSKTFLEGSSMLRMSVSPEDKINLEVEENTKFSVWVSFCEIYNENIHDLLEMVPSGAMRRTALRLSQDIKGNAFVKDLRWVKVNSAEEAYKVMKLGKKNQSFSSTRLNQLSSRSHSIFSIRILTIEDTGTPRVHTVSELCLCDLAGSERCAKTHNKGERLKEAGNINTSLLILGKCISALRHNQQAKLLQHVPFRESKLTHYLQGFFCGRGKACMIVNINQCASMYDETVNVLKFSAVAQKVVVLYARPLPVITKRSSSEVSFILKNTQSETVRGSSRSSVMGWERSLEDVQEDDDDEYEEENSLMEDIMNQTYHDEDGDENDAKIVISKKMHETHMELLKQLQVQLKKERAENLLIETRVREEASREFSELFSEMQKDYNERLVRETEILEERAERRLEIFKNLIDKMAKAQPSKDKGTRDNTLDSYTPDLGALKDAADAAQGELEKKGLRLNEHQKKVLEELAHNLNAEAIGADDEERGKLLHQLQEKSSEVARLEEQVADLQRTAVLGSLDLSPQIAENEKAQQASVQLRSAQTQLDSCIKEIQQKTSEIQSLKQELQQLRTSAESSDKLCDCLREEVSELRRNLAEEKEKCDSKHRQILELQQELEGAKEQLRKEELAFNKQLEQFTEKLRQQELASEEQLEELRKRLQEQEENLQQPLDVVQSKLECQEKASKKEIGQLRTELVEQSRSSEKQIKELSEKLQEQELISQRQLEMLKQKLSDEKETSDKLLDHLKQKLHEQEKTTELLKAELDQSRSSPTAAEDVKLLNSDSQVQTSTLATSESTAHSQLMSGVPEVKASADREAELQKKLLEKEALVTSLQKSLQETQDRQEEKESQAVQEARRKEVERRRELMAAANEAIAQKDEELQKKAEEISRLKENAQQDAESIKSLSLDLQRREDDSSDLKEKMADYKKQIQQVQKEISAMREEEKALRQKLADADKAKKQLQLDLTNRERTIQQLKTEQSSDTVSGQTLQLYQKARADLEAKERAMEDMRLALTEQEETQEQMEQVLEEKLSLIQELSSEVGKLKGILLQQDRGNNVERRVDSPTDEVKLAKEAASHSEENLKLCTAKHQAERKKWLEEKLSLISQAKEAEDKRNQEMRKFAEDRERHARQQSQLLAEKEQTMEKWRQERDALVAALEIQLKKLLCSQAEKDKLIQELSQNKPSPPPQEANSGNSVAELQSALSEKEAEIFQLKEDLKASTAKKQTPEVKVQTDNNNRTSGGKRVTRASVSSQGSSGFPSVLDSSEISTENGKTSRFPQPELEISFSPLQPNRMALRRQGDETPVTVKITRTARKRKSAEMEKEEGEAEKKKNTRTKMTPKLTPHQEEISGPAGRHDSQSSVRVKKEGTLQKIGDFLQSSPTLLGSKAKKMMSLMSGRGDADGLSLSSSSLSLKGKKKKKKLYRPEISSPMDMPSHPIINREPEEKESDHLIIKRRLRSRMVK